MLTQVQLKSILNYDPETGIFNRLGTTRKTGWINDKGYLIIEINGKNYRTNRLAWLWVHGYLPEFRIDHEDRDKLNNKISNLRPCTNSQNMANIGITNANSSGYRGVVWFKRDQCWRAQIMHNYKQIHIGYFKDIKEAAKAYNTKALELQGEFAYQNIIED